MKYRLQDLIDMEQFQTLQDRLNEIYSFPSAIIDNDGNILTATAWQDICTKFHRQNKECEKDCIKSDQYILSHIAEANPAVSYRCPHGLVDNATPIIIDGVHLGNFFTGQFFLEEPDLEFFRTQAQRYGFDEEAYLEAVRKVPVWTQEKLNSYLFFIRGLIEVISGIGLKNLRVIETRQKIEESEKQFQAMFETASIGIAQADPQTGQWVRVNQKMCDITGYTAEEMCTLRVPDITHPEDRERDWEAFGRVVRGEAPNYRLEKRYIRKDGTVVWVNVNMTVIRDAAGHPVRTMATIEDITARKQAEEALCQSEEIFRRLFTHSPVGVVMVGMDFRFQRCNETFCRFLGYRESELTGRTFVDVTFPEDRTVGAGEIQAILRNELDVAQFQKRYVRKDGNVVWGEVHIRMMRDQRGAQFLTIVQDITERKQAEEALRESEGRLRRAHRAARLGNWEWDLTTNELYWAEENYRIHGIDPQKVKPSYEAFIQVVDPAERAYVNKAVSDAVAGRKPLDIDYTAIRPDNGEACVINSKADVIVDSAGKAVGMAGTVQDVTERRQAEAALRESETRFRSLVEQAGDGFELLDAEGRYVDANSATCRQLAYSKEELLRLSIMDVDPQLSLERYAATFQSLVGSPPITFESMHRRKDGTVFPVEVTASVIQLGGVPHGLSLARDITERKRTEEALRESQERFQQLFDEGPLGVVLVDSSFKFVMVNPAFCTMLGYSELELKTMTFKEITHPDNLAVDLDNVSKLKVGELRVYSTEKRYIRKDQEVIWAKATITTLQDKNGQFTYFLGMIEDINERKRIGEVQAFLAQTSSGTANEPFFEVLARYLARSLGMDFVCIDRLEGNGLTARTVAIWCDGKFEDNVTYALKDTPCGEVVGKTVCCFPAGVRRSFPRDQVLQDLRAESYAGVTLWGHTGQPIGLIAVIGRRPLADRRTAEEMLKQVAMRAAGEMDRLEAEEALRQSEKLHRSLFENMLNGFAYCRMLFKDGKPRDFIYLAVNDAFESLTGLKNVIGRKVSEVIPGIQEADPQLIETYGRVALTGHPERFEVFVEALQMWFWISVYSPAREHFVAVFDVITERKLAEGKLREISGRLGLATASAKAGVWDWNFQTNEMIWDDRMLELYGLTRENFPGGIEAWEQGLHAEDSSRAIEECQAALRGEQDFDTEFRVRRPDGTVVHVKANGLVLRDEEGKPLRMIGLNTDITERKRIEEEVATILRTTIDGYYLVDMEGRFLDTNDAYCRMIGYSREEMLRMSVKDVEAIDTDEVIRARIQQIMETGYARFNTKHVRKDGRVIDIEASVNRLEGAQGKLVVFMRDTTERKQAEAEKARLEAQLLQAQKMESVGRLAGGVAHDFNNMLGVILGHAEMAMGLMDPAQPLYADLEEIRKAASRSADLTRQLLTFARKQTVAPKVLDLNETVAGMLKMLQRLLGEDIILNWHPSETLWPVKVDPSQIDQILANLCVNARDAITDVGKISIETGNKSIGEEYCADHVGFVPGEYVMLAVSDDGCGMDKETLAHLFEPFFTTKGMGKGTGLGLATVYGAVKQNNGFINVYSESGEGTTFTIYLPRYVGKAGQARTEGTAEPVLRGHETILLVEDEPAILKLAKRMLELQGYTVLAASTPGEAIRLAREYAGEIHLLMTDVVMPEMNGRALAKNLLSLYPRLKRLFMSGYTANVIAHHGVLDEGVYFIQKPFSTQNLAAKVREALGE